MRTPLVALLVVGSLGCGAAMPGSDGGGDGATHEDGGAVCDLTGSWSGTAMDVSVTPAITHTISLVLTQTGGSLAGTLSRDHGSAVPVVGSISGTSVSFHSGATPPDSSTLIYSAAAAPPCTAMSGDWNAIAMAHGPLSLARSP